MALPKAESEFLNNVLSALSKRTKALKHKVSKYSYQIEEECHEGQNYERLNIDLDRGRHYASIRLSIWEDRYVFLNAGHQMSSGKMFNSKLTGRIGAASGKDIVATLEKTLKLQSRFLQGVEYSDSMDYNEFQCRDIIRECWQKIILTGPERVVD